MFNKFKKKEEQNHYQVLGLEKDATPSQIKKAYHKLALIHHPDKINGNSEKFNNINNAYQVLSDPSKKQMYDSIGFYNNNMNGDFEGLFSTASKFTNLFNESSNLGSLFSQPTKHLKYDLECSLEELFYGTTKTINLTRNIQTKKNGPITKEKKSIDLQIKPGWKDGTKITYNEHGNILYGKKPQDLIIIIKEKKHIQFKRCGDDLYTQIKITLKESLVGFDREIINLDNKSVFLKTDEMTTPEKYYFLEEKGMPNLKKGKRGILNIQCIIMYPDKLTDEQKKIIQEIL